MSSFWFSRWWKQPARPARPRDGRKARLDVEALEERMLMNNRFVVPAGLDDGLTKFATLKAAFAAPGLSAGDVIQIEPGANLGVLGNADIPDLKNLTIQGDPGVDVSSLPVFGLDAVTIDPAQQGFTLRNVKFVIEGGTLTIDADATITGAQISDNVANGPGIQLNGTSAVVISNSYIGGAVAANVGNDIVQVNPAAGSHNLITDNTIVYQDGTNLTLLGYNGGTGISDLVAHNTFVGKASPGSGSMIVVNGTQGLTLQGNTLSGSDSNEIGIEIDPSSQNIKILDNDISFPNGFIGLEISGGQAGVTTSAIIANNHIDAGPSGIGINVDAGSPGSVLTAKIQGNDLRDNSDGVEFGGGNGGPLSGIDLGGGSQGSLGANNFRGFVPGIGYAINNGLGLVQAQMNLFSVADPQTVIYDGGAMDTVATNPLTGNAAYVQTLYLDFLHRAGDVSSPQDAGAWVTQLNNGAPAATVANAIARSGEALGVQVDGLYHRLLRREADAAGLAGWVFNLQHGATLEWVTQQIAASPEYQTLHVSDDAFINSLYYTLLHRGAGSTEVAAWEGLLPTIGRAGVAQGFLSSQEFRGREVGDDYAQLLHRSPSAGEAAGWVGSGLDLLSIDSAFAGSPEFELNA